MQTLALPPKLMLSVLLVLSPLALPPKLMLSVLLVLSPLALIGCDKKESTTQQTPTTNASSATTTSASISSVATTPINTANSATTVTQTDSYATTTVSTLSPTLEFWVAYARVGAFELLTQKYSNMTPEQKACLASHEGDINYSKELQPFMTSILTPRETTEADKFFASALGKKFAIMSKAQIDASIPMPEVSEAETAAIMAEFQKPYMIKLQKQTANADPKVGKDMLLKSVVAEQARCKIV